MIKKILKKIIPSKIKKIWKNQRLNCIKKDLRNTECIYKINYEDKGKLDGKVAVITGGSGAIGSAISFRLAMEGAIVIVCGRNKDNIQNVIKMIEQNKGKAYPLQLDVTNASEIEESFKEINEKYGKIDILVNNAGGSSRANSKDLVNQEIDVIDMVINSNLRGTIICCKYAAKYMIEKKYGKIVNIGSTTGIQGNAQNVDYAAAKAGIIGMTKALSKELGKYGINVNCVSPGRVNQILFDEVLEDIHDDGAYIERKGKTSEVAAVVDFLVDDKNSFITGQNIVIDGGRSLGLKGS